jgi:hypothetical protein
MTYVKNFHEFINEGLNKEQWLNYKEDTYLTLDNPGDDEVRVAKKVMELLQENNPTNILFTTDTDSLNYDYDMFKKEVLSKSVKKLENAIKFEDYVAYYEHYEYEEKPIVVIYVKDMQDSSYIFIKNEDFEFFNDLFGGGDVQQEEDVQEESEEIQGDEPTDEEEL